MTPSPPMPARTHPRARRSPRDPHDRHQGLWRGRRHHAEGHHAARHRTPPRRPQHPGHPRRLPERDRTAPRHHRIRIQRLGHSQAGRRTRPQPAKSPPPSASQSAKCSKPPAAPLPAQSAPTWRPGSWAHHGPGGSLLLAGHDRHPAADRPVRLILGRHIGERGPPDDPPLDLSHVEHQATQLDSHSTRIELGVEAIGRDLHARSTQPATGRRGSADPYRRLLRQLRPPH
jgi:hypothetical protein